MFGSLARGLEPALALAMARPGQGLSTLRPGFVQPDMYRGEGGLLFRGVIIVYVFGASWAPYQEQLFGSVFEAKFSKENVTSEA